jgi:hypothetical protein
MDGLTACTRASCIRRQLQSYIYIQQRQHPGEWWTGSGETEGDWMAICNMHEWLDYIHYAGRHPHMRALSTSERAAVRAVHLFDHVIMSCDDYQVWFMHHASYCRILGWYSASLDIANKEIMLTYTTKQNHSYQECRDMICKQQPCAQLKVVESLY